jgi:GntR family transcriptional regulator, transcriptional repressor for pyruvate dehydrogenase complex
MAEFRSIVTASLTKQIASSVREAILRGDVKVDQRLPTEEELARQFGVSRPTIREALKRLAAENLIHSLRGPQGGSLVKRPSPDEVSETMANALRLLASFGEFSHEDILEARCEFESMCCRIIVSRKGSSRLANMRAELAAQRNTGLTDEEFCASDVRFHKALIEAAQNTVFQYILFAISDALQPITNLVIFRFRERKIICDQHQALIDALAEGDAEAAVAVLQKQARYLIESYRKAQNWGKQHDGASRSKPSKPDSAPASTKTRRRLRPRSG